MPKNSRFNEVRAQCSLGTRWLWFYARVLLLLHMIFASLGIFVNFSQLIVSEYKYNIILSLVYAGICLWLSINAYTGIANFTERGYKYNLVYLWFVACGSVLLQLLSGIATAPGMLGALIGASLFLVPNLIYFKKRRSLFSLTVGDQKLP